MDGDRAGRRREGSFLEINPQALASSSLGRSQQAVDQLFSTTIAETASGGPTIVFINEVETIATDRSQLSFDANPADVHRAVDAALVGLDRVARNHPDVLFIATSNFPQAIDSALLSRADLIVTIDLANEQARYTIFEDTLYALAEAFPGARRLIEPSFLRRATDDTIREKLVQIGNVASMLISEEHTAPNPIVPTGCGPQVRLYTLHGSTAIDGTNVNENSLTITAADTWQLSLPASGEDFDLAVAALMEVTNVDVYDPNASSP